MKNVWLSGSPPGFRRGDLLIDRPALQGLKRNPDFSEKDLKERESPKRF
jgi:hypothetical protein